MSACCNDCARHGCGCGCGTHAGTPLPLYNRPGLPALSYRIGGYAGFRATMRDALSAGSLPALAGLRTREPDDPSMALLDAWAVGADVLTFYQERIANEGYLRTATERRSVTELARLVDYRPRPGVAASVHLAYTIDRDSPPVTIPAGARAQSVPAPGEQMQTFETSAPLRARHEWNVLKPRLTRPQDVRVGNVDWIGELWIAGTDSRLKANDRLLFVFGKAESAQYRVRKVLSVEPDDAGGRSRIRLQPETTPPEPSRTHVGPDLRRLYGALKAAPSLQPANSTRLARSAATVLGRASDARPQLLLNLDARLANSFYPAWTGTAQSLASPELAGVYAMRMSAPLFGYNAPQRAILRLPENLDQVSGHEADGDGDWKVAEEANVLSLDNAYEGIVSGSHVLIHAPGEKRSGIVARVETVEVRPRSAYAISGKTTMIKLVHADDEIVWDPPPDMTALRKVSVHAQSEPLELAELTITGDIGPAGQDREQQPGDDPAKRIVLDQAVDGIETGRWAIVEGLRADVEGATGVRGAELVMIEAVEQRRDDALSGDTVHTTLVLANDGLAYRYRRDSVGIRCNVVHATHGETRSEVLGSGDGAAAMQRFVLKQPPLTHVPAATRDGTASTLTLRVNDVRWHETRNLAFAGAADRAFVTVVDDAGATAVVFGDGRHGARLPTGIENVRAVYRQGIGRAGNVAAGQVSLATTRPLGVKDVLNPLRATGGADPEPRDQVRGNAPLAVLALDRLVSVRDYADFARTFGGVGKAAAVRLGDLVHVTIAGADDAPIDPSSDLHRNLLRAFHRLGDASLRIALGVRELLALTLSAKVGVETDHAWESVEPRVRGALLDAFGFERRALARDIHLSEIVACIQAVRGVGWVDVDAFDALDEDALVASLADAPDPHDGEEGGVAVLAAAVPGRAASRRERTPAVASRVRVREARFDRDDEGAQVLRPAQLAYFAPNVPDTLLLQEARA